VVDLLRSSAGCVAITAVVAFSGCASKPSRDPEVAEPENPISAVRPDEAVLFDRVGSGPDAQGFQMKSGGRFNVYGLCTDRSTVRIQDIQSTTVDLKVKCDGVTTRTQVYTSVGVPVDLRVEAATGSSWAVLVTALR
jgi:hypothetical protein